MTLNVAVVGLGNIGNRHAGIYQAHPQCEVVAVCDAIEEKAASAAQRYSCRAFTSVEEMLASDFQIDVASVCTAGDALGAAWNR